MMTRSAHEVLAYSAMEDAELAEYAALIHAACPDIALVVERMSSTALRERLLEEGSHGRWDVVFGWSLTHLADPDILPLLAPASALSVERLPATAYARDLRWLAPSGFVPAFCVDHRRLREWGLPIPRSWHDLADPRFRGQIVLPDPRRSGAGFLHLAALLQCAGPEYAWSVLGEVAAGSPEIVNSANAPCLAVIEGRAAIGVSVSTSTAALIAKGHDLTLVIPEDAPAYEPEGFAMRQGCARPDLAQRALRWTLSEDAASTYRRYNKLPLTHPLEDSGGPGPLLRPIDVGAAIAARDLACRQWARCFAPECLSAYHS